MPGRGQIGVKHADKPADVAGDSVIVLGKTLGESPEFVDFSEVEIDVREPGRVRHRYETQIR
jgi:hypothetical protein